MTETLPVLLAQYEGIAAKLKAERKALAQNEGNSTLERVAAEGIRARIVDLEVELVAVGAAVDRITSAEEGKRKLAGDHARWKGLVVECRQARATQDRTARELAAIEVKLGNARDHVDFSQHELEIHKRTLLQPSDYPLEAELEREKEQTAKLEEEVLKARAACKELNVRRSDVQMAALRARKRFEELAAQEVRLRPPSKNAPANDFRVASIG